MATRWIISPTASSLTITVSRSYPTPNQHGPRVTTDLSYISDHDGTSHTVLFSENVDAADWIGPNFQSPLNNMPAQAQTWGQGIVWRLNDGDTSSAYGPTYPTYAFFLNRDLDALNRAYNTSFQRSDNYSAKPTSAHSGGFLLTMVGGNTLFVSEDIDYRVYVMAMAPWSSTVENKDPIDRRGCALSYWDEVAFAAG